MSSIGTEYKINIKMEPMGEIHLANCDFEAKFYTGPAMSQSISKAEMVYVDDDDYIALVDSSKTGQGALMMRLTVELPDADFDDGRRTEVQVLNTGIVVEK